MANETIELSGLAKRAADDGELIEAIKIVRQTLKVDLETAKDAVEYYLQHRVDSIPATKIEIDSGVPLEAVALLHQGNLISAIKSTREKMGCDLKESKEAVEKYLAEHPDTKQRFDDAKALAGSRLARIIEILLLVCAGLAGYLLFTGSLKW
ncbi:MAG: hypothetical protein U1F34_04865 [Gammaproteobacteria bacterium]